MLNELKIENLGYNETLEKFRIKNNLTGFKAGRVIIEHKERYIVLTEKGDFEAEIIGKMRFTAENREDFPTVGDWVAIQTYDSGQAIIHAIFPRKSLITRQDISEFSEKQLIAANIDFAFILQAVDHDFNINRIERYLTICNSAKVEPILILTKTDLINEIELGLMLNSIQARIIPIQIIPISNNNKNGYDKLDKIFIKGKTYCFLGSSGVGKSTLINNLAGSEYFKTNLISSSTNKGKHTTTHRELVLLKNGSICIDNPGMREIGVADNETGIEITFDTIIQLSQNCKFSDCTHTREIGCAVINAVNKGKIDIALYQNYLKLKKEVARFQISVEEKKKKNKVFGRMYKKAIKFRKENKY